MTGRTLAHRQAGFTLLELAAALVLLAIGFFVLMGGMGQATRSLRADQEASRMALRVRSVFDTYANARLAPGVQVGYFEDGLQWRMAVTPAGGWPTLPLYRLQLTLQSDAREAQFSTLRVQRDEPADGVAR